MALSAAPAEAPLFAGAIDLPPALLREFGSTVVIAPHPDDESIGCGGLIALLHDAGQPVWPILVTDGSRSHPGSRQFDAAARTALRDAEWQQALACLQVPAERLSRLGLVDGDVPLPGDARFAPAVQRLRQLLTRIGPSTLVLPWRRDPHPDHRATHALVDAAIGPRQLPPRRLEYVVWLAERAETADAPQPGEVQTWRLDIASAVDRKRQAIARHRSQLGQVITDDPDGFTLAPAMRQRAEAPAEYFYQSRHPTPTST